MRERLAGLLLCLAVCLPARSLASTTVRDDTGRALTLAQTPQRIVSLLPALTEMVCQLGQCHRLVGLDRYSSWPPQVAALPRVGGGLDPSIEAVLALKPDLVLMARSTRGAERLQALGVPTLMLEPRNQADVQRILLTLGQVLALPDAARIWQGIDAGLSAAAQAMPASARRWRVYFEVGDGPFAASQSSFIGETLARLGLGNVVPGQLGPFPKINPEMVVRADPDLILVGERQGGALAERPGWQAMRAVREGRVCVFTAAESDILVRPGPRMAEAAQLMLRCVQEVSRRTGGQRP
jgi:iron complex transport system substrate-binding protein